MQYFRIEGVMVDEKWTEKNENRNFSEETRRKIFNKSREFNENFKENFKENGFFFMVSATENIIKIGAIIVNEKNIDKFVDNYINEIEFQIKDITIEEIIFKKLENLLDTALRMRYIENYYEILENFCLIKLSRSDREQNYEEKIIDKFSKNEIYDSAQKYISTETFIPELDRIYKQKSEVKIMGHPVHYMIETDDEKINRELSQKLLSALYYNNRLFNKRYFYLKVCQYYELSNGFINAVYNSNIGGAVIWKIESYGHANESDLADEINDLIEKICRKMKKYRNDVLTIFCLPRECKTIKKYIFENIGNTTMIEIREDFVSGQKAKEFLSNMANNIGIKADNHLYEKLDANDNYLAPDLREIFDEWYDNKLKTSIFPQYENVISAKKYVSKEKISGDAYKELMEMIGLNEAKEVINKALDYFKAQKLFADKGMPIDQPAMHMMFSGNPGTAKTSVARLFARIMKDNNILSKGHLVEVGRANLVGKYVGWTAPIIKEKFKQARGGVLFIDEAYSLVDDRKGSFGDEAINTIVQEMENYRDEVIVIFAGYSDEMEKFLQRNPGLSSRIAYHIPFRDYTTGELCKIAKMMANKKGITISNKAMKKLNDVFNVAALNKDFGNGRYVRNVIEKARMCQAKRLLQKDYDSISQNDLSTIIAADIEMPIKENKNNKTIGFVV